MKKTLNIMKKKKKKKKKMFLCYKVQRNQQLKHKQMQEKEHRN